MAFRPAPLADAGPLTRRPPCCAARRVAASIVRMWACCWPTTTCCYTCRSVLPLRLIFVARITRVAPQRLIEGRVEGELVGVGRYDFNHCGGLTTVSVDRQVHTTSRWLNRMGPLAAPLLRWNHDRLMRNGGRGVGARSRPPPGRVRARTS